MQMDSCLILLCLFVFVERAAADVSLSCDQNETVESGHNLTVHCELNSINDHRGCKAKDDMLVCECGGKPLDCSLKNGPTTGRIQNLSVEFHNINISGTYTITLDETTCGAQNVKAEFDVTVIQPVAEIIGTPTESPVTEGYIALAVACVALALVAIIAMVILGIKKHRRDRPTAEGQGKYQRAAQTSV